MLAFFFIGVFQLLFLYVLCYCRCAEGAAKVQKWWWENGSVLTGYWSGSIRNQCSKCFGPCFLIEPCQYHVPLLSNPHIKSVFFKGSKLFLFCLGWGGYGKSCFMLHFFLLLFSPFDCLLLYRLSNTSSSPL